MEAIIRYGAIESGERSWPLSSIVGIIPTNAGVSVTMRSGESIVISDYGLMSVLHDMCPWAIYGV